MKTVLVISYSQTGQLSRSVESLVGGLEGESFRVTRAVIRPRPAYPFPWSFSSFFGVFSDCVLGHAPLIDPLDLDPDSRFDLVILGYQVWFLAPSLPIQGFLRSPHARVLAGTRVITLVVCRNMWHTASERMKRMIADAGGIQIDNVVVTDPSPPWATFVTTPRWMFTGKRDAFGGIFPPAGVPEEDIAALARFGKAIAAQERALEEACPRPLFMGLGAAKVESRYVIPELIGRFTFPIWARFFRASRRFGSLAGKLATSLFVVYLAVTILFLVPLAILLRGLLHPVIRGRLRSYVERLESPSGNAARVRGRVSRGNGATR